MKVALFGLTVFSDNKGCEALAYSFLNLLQEICCENSTELDVVIYIFSQKENVTFLENPGWQNLSIVIKKIHFRKSIFNWRFWKSLKEDVKKSTVCFDFTEGDSFTDLYGLKRFCAQTFIKNFVIKKGRNLVLGPQTFGPYKTVFSRIWASWVIAHAKKVYSRDELSLLQIPKKKRRDVQVVTDIAVALKPDVRQNIKNCKIKVGVNISGLLWNGGYTQNNQFNLRVDYKAYIEGLLKILSENKAYKVYLIPHVITLDDFNSVENDLKICLEMHRKFPDTKLIDNDFSPAALKGVISQMDVFTGARMHSTIAALSTEVPVIPFSYSRKFEGFFKALEYNYIIDGNILSTEEALRESLKYIVNANELKLSVCKSCGMAEDKILMFYNEVKSLLT